MRIDEIAPDFRVEDVWQLPMRLGPDDFPRLVEMIAAGDPTRRGPRAVRVLMDVRLRLGKLLGWDDAAEGLGARVPSLRERLPADLRDTLVPTAAMSQLTPLYVTDDEFAAEVANRTVHGVLHLARIADETGGCHAQMTVLVKPNGLLGRGYMAAIKPFRHLIVYPALFRSWERAWERRSAAPVSPAAPGTAPRRESSAAQ